MRHLLTAGSWAFAAAAFFILLRSDGAEPAKADDPWTGTYLKFSQYDSGRTGQFGEAQKITITKEGDAYKLSKPFDTYKFVEKKKGYLEDEKAILGHLSLGSMEFSDGKKGRVLHAEFCYESFYLMGGLDDEKKPADKKTQPLKLEEAEKLVRDHIFTENPKMNPAAEFPVKDVTPKAVWDRLDAQVFKVTEGVQANETFVIRNKIVRRIGGGFGGHGVSSLVVADPSGDGRDKLFYAYAWGSGVHRSQVAVLDLLAKEPQQVVVAQAYFGRGDDLEVMNGDKQTVEVFAGKQRVGKLIVEGKEKALKVDLRLDDDLPADVKKGFKGGD